MKNLKTLRSLFVIILLPLLVFIGCSESKNETSKSDKKDVVSASNKGKKLAVSPESKLEWVGKKVTGEHHGTVDINKGELFTDNGKLTGGSFEINFATIKNLDIKDTASNAKLTGHLKSDDFFSAEKFPLGKFDITSATSLSDGSGNNYLIKGNLTVKGITKEISFPANVNITDDKTTATADFKIDRTTWDIKYGSGKFFEKLGDKMISDDINIKLNIAAK
ncbi:MAG: YceI family protein [Bacteroidota bacterium]|nr:YceI family protein [Bacteroidota bacterium]